MAQLPPVFAAAAAGAGKVAYIDTEGGFRCAASGCAVRRLLLSNPCAGCWPERPLFTVAGPLPASFCPLPAPRLPAGRSASAPLPSATGWMQMRCWTMLCTPAHTPMSSSLVGAARRRC